MKRILLTHSLALVILTLLMPSPAGAWLAEKAASAQAGHVRMAEPVFVNSVAQSEVAVVAAEPGSLQSESKELSRDDGASAGKRSVAGSGHAVRFQAPAKDWYLTGVKIFGSRYGHPQPPPDHAYVWLCDTDFKLITAFPFPYASFERGEAKWVTIPIKPTQVPDEFVLCAGFNPTATKGVYVHHDREASGQSFLALPGRKGNPFDKGDWMIRAVGQIQKEK